jgi:hypothetical protein
MSNGSVTAQKLSIYVDPVHSETQNNEIFSRFNGNPVLRSIPVVNHGKRSA